MSEPKTRAEDAADLIAAGIGGFVACHKSARSKEDWEAAQLVLARGIRLALEYLKAEQ